MTSVGNCQMGEARQPSGPCAPLYLHDLAELIHSHLLARKPDEILHYPQMRALFEQHNAHRLHTAGPRCLPVAIHTQHLYQGVILFVHSPSMVDMLCCSLQQPRSTSSFPPLVESDIIAASIALLVLLHLSQPPPCAERIRLDPPAIARIRSTTAGLPEARALLNSIAATDGLRLVAQLRHAGAPAPMNITSSPIHPLVMKWSPRNWFGLAVSPTEATTALAARKPICPLHTPQYPTLASDSSAP